MASMVEFVEALTIVLAVGAVRGWRSALIGTAAALATLVALVATLGPLLTRIPLAVAQMVVGTLLLLFGLRWLRKAVLRAAGVLPLHDEERAFETQTVALREQGPRPTGTIDALAFVASFKIVMLEGLEVVFIVIAIGASGTMLIPAVIGAALALAVVLALGLALHRPLRRVPENTLKFGVGVMLSAFGTFWVGEGAAGRWPGGDWTLLALIAIYLVVGLALVQTCWRERVETVTHAKPAASDVRPRSGVLAVIVREIVGLFIDDLWLAGAVVACVSLAWFTERYGPTIPLGVAGYGLSAALAIVLIVSAVRRARLGCIPQ